MGLSGLMGEWWGEVKRVKEIKRYISDEVLSRLSVTRCG